MQYEIMCSLVHSSDTPNDLAVRQVLEAVAALERVLNRNNVASMVQVRDLRRGEYVREARHLGHLAAPSRGAMSRSEPQMAAEETAYRGGWRGQPSPAGAKAMSHTGACCQGDGV